MSSIKTVAVAGAGSLGKVVVKELVASGFTVTALTRGDSKDVPCGVKIQQVDYSNSENLQKALEGQDAVISTITTAGAAAQSSLIDAAIAAGAKRFIPSEFGCDLSNPKARALPVYRDKVQIEEDLEKKTQGTGTTYTYIFNNAFLDWGIDMGFIIDAKNKKFEIYDGGEQPFTTTPLSMVAKAVVGVLKHPEETKNTGVRVHGVRMTQNKLLELVQKQTGKDGWQITETTTADEERKAWDNLKQNPGNVMSWVLGFLKTAIFREGYGGDYSANNDNKLLGLQEMSESEVEELVRSRI